jgi:hypothetical protein
VLALIFGMPPALSKLKQFYIAKPEKLFGIYLILWNKRQNKFP